MLILYKIIFVFFFISGLLSFVRKRKHLLSTLLRLEFMVLSIFFYIFILLIFSFLDTYFLIYFLTFSVCEGALGLSILVSIIRSHGTDQFANLNILQC